MFFAPITGCLLVPFLMIMAPASGFDETIDISGTYTLVAANDRGLPAAVSENKQTKFRQEVVRGSVTLNGNFTFSWRTACR